MKEIRIVFIKDLNSVVSVVSNIYISIWKGSQKVRLSELTFLAPFLPKVPQTLSFEVKNLDLIIPRFRYNQVPILSVHIPQGGFKKSYAGPSQRL